MNKNYIWADGSAGKVLVVHPQSPTWWDTLVVPALLWSSLAGHPSQTSKPQVFRGAGGGSLKAGGKKRNDTWLTPNLDT